MINRSRTYGHAWNRKENKFLKDSLNLLANDSSTFSDNSSTSFSVNSLFATIAFNSSILSNCALSNFLTTTCHSIPGNCSISSFNSSGILIVNSPISITANNVGYAYIKHFLSKNFSKKFYQKCFAERTCAKKGNLFPSEKKTLRKSVIAVLLVKLFFKPLQGLRGSGAEPRIRKGFRR